MFENYDYTESIFHKSIPYLLKWAFYTLIGRFIYLRINETYKRKIKSQKKLNEVRNKIAYEMHQDIGNDLSALIYKIKLWHLKNKNVNSQEYIQLERSALKVMTKVNEIVWSLNTEKSNLKALQNHLINYAEETLLSINIVCEITTTNKLPIRNIELEIKKNIYLIFKEAINNLVKHANANRVNIEFNYHYRKFQITIKDDGKGFNFDKIVKGNGLDSMQNRIKQLNGKIEFLPNQPKGTIVKFELKV